MANSKKMLKTEAERAYLSVSKEITKEGLEIVHKKTQIEILNEGRRLKEI